MTLLQKVENDRLTLVKLIRQYADLNTDALLDPLCQVFTSDQVKEGIIGYRQELNHAVVFGDPVCAPQNKLTLAQAFQEYCQAKNLQIIYTMTSGEFKNAVQHLCPVSLEFGHQFIFDPKENAYDKSGSKSRVVRRKCHHATNEGVTIHEFLDGNLEVEQAIEGISQSWLKKRHGPQIHISHLRLFDDRLGKRWFYAKKDELVVGFLILNQVDSQSGWLMNNLMLHPDAPHGTSELLVVSTIQMIGKEAEKIVIYGPVPSQTLGDVQGLKKMSSWFIRETFKIAKKVFRLEAQGIFWEKFQPKTTPSYLLFDQSKISLKAIMALMRAMNATSK